MCVPVVDPDCDPIGEAAKNAALTFLQTLSEELTKAATWSLKLIFTGWLEVPTDNVSDTTGAVPQLRGYTAWIVAAVAVGAVLFSGLKLALQRDGKEAGSLA